MDLPLTDDSSHIDAVVNLSGENIYGKWTKEKKRKILDSRVQTTKLLCKTLASINRPPKVLVAASATGYYGDRGNEILSEDNPSTAGSSLDFLSHVCKQWEEATQIAKDAGIRVVNMRTSIVLSSYGGMLAKILPIFKLGLGGKLGVETST
jgi:uncharacterized protein